MSRIIAPFYILLLEVVDGYDGYEMNDVFNSSICCDSVVIGSTVSLDEALMHGEAEAPAPEDIKAKL